MVERILAFDSATRTGWAAFADGQVRSGVQPFYPQTGDRHGTRWVRFRTWVCAQLAEYRPELVVYELPVAHHPGAVAAEVAYGLMAHLQAACEEAGLEYVGLEPTALKKWATGAGNALKPAMQERATELYPHYSAARDPGADEADALLLLAWARAGMPPPPSATKPKRRKTAKTAG